MRFRNLDGSLTIQEFDIDADLRFVTNGAGDRALTMRQVKIRAFGPRYSRLSVYAGLETPVRRRHSPIGCRGQHDARKRVSGHVLPTMALKDETLRSLALGGIQYREELQP